jgi:hypothetical protein
MADGGFVPNGGCIRTGKVMYESEGAARDALRALYRSRNNRLKRKRAGKDDLMVFYCGTCARWHIGSRWKR